MDTEKHSQQIVNVFSQITFTENVNFPTAPLIVHTFQTFSQFKNCTFLSWSTGYGTWQALSHISSVL